MKKSILIVIVILLIAIIGTVIFVKISNKKTSGEDNPMIVEKVKLSNTEGINTALTLEDEIKTEGAEAAKSKLMANVNNSANLRKAQEAVCYFMLADTDKVNGYRK